MDNQKHKELNSILWSQSYLKIGKEPKQICLREVLHIYECIQNQITGGYYFIPVGTRCYGQKKKGLAWYHRSVILACKDKAEADGSQVQGKPEQLRDILS